MTVPFDRPDPEEHHRALSTYRDDPEPPLAELLGDPTLHTLMARDGINRADLERLVAATRRRLRLQPRLPRQAIFESTLFAECGAS